MPYPGMFLDGVFVVLAFLHYEVAAIDTVYLSELLQSFRQIGCTLQNCMVLVRYPSFPEVLEQSSFVQRHLTLKVKG